jgi:uncharacterized membrane protein YdjX (TVP38/TMEM64 family)
MSLIKLESKLVIKLVFLTLIFTIIAIVGIKTVPWLIEHGRSPEYIREYLSSFGNAGFLIYVLIQAIQVIIVVIPGDLFSICGGFVYGIPLGFALSFLGLMSGSVIAFYISRLLGHDFVSSFIAKEKIEKISEVLNSTKGAIGMFVICTIPFIPKDVMIYIAGLTPVKASRLFLIYGLSRVPSILIWVSIGSDTYEKDYWGVAIIISILLVLLAAVFFTVRYIIKKKGVSIEKLKHFIKIHHLLKNK